MRKSENGITLVSLVVTIVVLSVLIGLLMKVSIGESPVIEEVKNIQNTYYIEKQETEQTVQELTSDWEDIIN